MAVSSAVYRPRNPQVTDDDRCVQGHLEMFIQIYEERFERTYGFFRPCLQKVIDRYLDCGDLHNGFAMKEAKERKIFDAREWLTSMCSHVPNRGERMVRYCGWYRTVARGKRQKKTEGDLHGLCGLNQSQPGHNIL